MANEGTQAILKLSASRPHESVKRAISLLDSAIGELNAEHSAKCTIVQAVSILREQIAPQAAAAPDGKGRLLAWQARKVRDYIDSHITGRVLVPDLCALIQRSEAHFSRYFKRTFGESPHSFIVLRRVELAARYMLTTDASLSDIALRCGFTDQAHLCKHFRQSTGQTPAAWRRARRTQDSGNSVASLSSVGVVARPVGSNDRQAREFSRGSRSPLRGRQPEPECGSRV
jgi:AraC-like DNA-binding protein